MPLPIDAFRARTLSLPSPVIMHDNSVEKMVEETPKVRSRVLKPKRDISKPQTLFVR